jgi:hypothetical protein
MNYIKHLTGFFERIMMDRNLNPTHISLYIALFQFWNINRFQNPISITRDEVMRICKISSKATYHKCMRDLNEKGYIKYEPSYNPYKGSFVTLYDFSELLKLAQKKSKTPEKNLTNNEQVMNKQETGSETSTETSNEQALVSSINNTNITNNSNIPNDLNLEEQAKNFQNDNEFLKTETSEKREKSFAKKEMFELLADDNRQIVQTFADTNEKQTEKSRQKEFLVTSSTSSRAFDIKRRTASGSQVFLSPTFDEVKSYFLQQNFPELEANKFFNYFSSVGWLIGGKIPMVDWQAAAQNWILNAIKFKSYEKPPDRAKHLNTQNDKDYSEPL